MVNNRGVVGHKDFEIAKNIQTLGIYDYSNKPFPYHPEL